ncbi:thioether cross-link-forming SCIFF peptide maturase [Clostridia bacterium]|nr:thioether cross-link-forming SCIFF peptide maturase [Clostridia bacterium]
MMHKYCLHGFHIVVDPNSGSVHFVDKLVFDLLDYVKGPLSEELPKELFFCQDYGLKDIEEAYCEIYKLYKNKLLFSEPSKPNISYTIGHKIPIKAACLHISHDCDLRCRYCFAGAGAFGGKRMNMSLDVGKKAIDFLLKRSLSRKNIEVDFFGGEPLLNFDVVQGVVSYAREQEKKTNKSFRFTLTTNGIGLDDEKVDYLNQEMSSVALSIDGRKATNDRMRVHTDGTGCYDEILPKFKDLVAKRGGKNYYVRGTFTRMNLDFTDDILHLVDEGFKEISLEPVVSDETSPYSITEKELPQVLKEYERLAAVMIDKEKQKQGFNFYHFSVIGKNSPCMSKRVKGCGAGAEYVAITPDADIYPCHQLVGMKEYIMGNVMEGIVDVGKQVQFASININFKKKCADCWAKLYCSGGCNANNVKFGHDFSKPHEISCEIQKKRLECTFVIEAAREMLGQNSPST